MDENNKTLDAMRDRIFYLLEKEHVSQKEFSKLLGTTPQTITDWKKGKSRSYTQKIPLIAAILHSNTNWIVDGSGVPGASKEEADLYPLLDTAYTSRFVKFDGTHTNSANDTPISDKEKGPAAEDGHEPSENELLFTSLSPEKQEEALRYMRYLASQE